MILVALKQTQNTGPIRHAAQNKLDKVMLDVLKKSELNVYKKAKWYASILQLSDTAEIL